MVIEWLKFTVSPDQREKFIRKDEEIWTASLQKSPGFLGKEVWINPNTPSEVIFVIHWATREAWKAIPVSELENTERQFAKAFGEHTYKLIEAGEYQVRKFP